MERVQKFLFALLWVFCYACNSEQEIPSVQTPMRCTILSRGENVLQHLPSGSNILVNANGGLELENETFTYNGHLWKSEKDYSWNDPQKETHIIALYPTYADNRYTSENLYSNGTLEDVLIARKILDAKDRIDLQFEHLFSKLTIHVEDDILEHLKELSLTIPNKIEEVFPATGTFSTISESSIVVQSNNGDNDYSFILPPMEQCILTLTLVMTDQVIHEIALAPHSFKSGIRYECNLINTDTRPGIRTALDLIAFSQLINGTYKGNKTLADFGEEIGGETIYYLLNDIELTEEECNSLETIGYNKNKSFSNTFDGLGHTIYNLKFKAQNGFGGFFGKTEATSIIKNLTISNGSGAVKKGDHESGIGFIAGQCYGTISNCHVINSTLTDEESVYTGGIAGYTIGKIINCSVTNTTLDSSIASLGFITGYLNKGKIINSYSFKNTIKGKTNSRGGITGYSTSSIITNCYVYKNSYNDQIKNKGLIIGSATNTTVEYCYYNPSTTIDIIYNMPNNCTMNSNYEISTSFTSTEKNTPVYQLLNQWIEEQTTYNDTFRQWTTAADGSPCFQ